MGSALKKSLFPSEQPRPAIILRRHRWKRILSMNARRFVFIDETAFKTNMIRTHGWGEKGKRLKDYAPFGHWKKMTFLAALRSDRIDAPCLLEQPLNTQSFLVYVKHFLLPTLREKDIVILDNLIIHKNRQARQMIREKGAKIWFLPPYSPDLNPIEMVFAKLKTMVRKCAARTQETLSEAIAQVLRTFTENECLNYLRAAGYE